MIELVKLNTYRLNSRGNDMTLKRSRVQGRWEMTTVNAATRTYKGVMPSVRYFDKLEEVEKRYKSWRGIVALHRSFAESH